MNNQIGIFDSGVGGLSIFKTLKKKLPLENYFYLADQMNCPYGTKKPAEIKKLAYKNVSFLVKKQCKLIILACNTVTVSAIKFLRLSFPKIPFVGVVPPVGPAIKQSQTGHVIILSTPATQKSNYLKRLIKKHGQNKVVYNLSSANLVGAIEKGVISGNKINELLKICFQKVIKDPKIDVLATGCTHYPFIKNLLTDCFKQRIVFVEPSFSVAKQVKNILVGNNLLSSKKTRDYFLTTGSKKKFRDLVAKFSGLP